MIVIHFVMRFLHCEVFYFNLVMGWQRSRSLLFLGQRKQLALLYPSEGKLVLTRRPFVSVAPLENGWTRLHWLSSWNFEGLIFAKFALLGGDVHLLAPVCHQLVCGVLIVLTVIIDKWLLVRHRILIYFLRHLTCTERSLSSLTFACQF